MERSKVQIGITLAPQSIAQLDALTEEERRNTGQAATRSSVVAAMITAATTAERVVAVWEQTGKRRKLVGFNGFVEGNHQVAFEEPTEREAWAKVHAHIFEEVSR